MTSRDPFQSFCVSLCAVLPFKELFHPGVKLNSLIKSLSMCEKKCTSLGTAISCDLFISFQVLQEQKKSDLQLYAETGKYNSNSNSKQ